MNINNINNQNINLNTNNIRSDSGISPNENGDINTSVIENPVRIRTVNNLFLIERDNLVVQSSTQVDLWVIEQTDIIRKIRNLNSGRYMGLSSQSKENYVRIATVPRIEFLINEWIFYNIAFFSGLQFVNTFSSKALDVPENSSESGVVLIQFNRKTPFTGINNQRFFIEEV